MKAKWTTRAGLNFKHKKLVGESSLGYYYTTTARNLISDLRFNKLGENMKYYGMRNNISTIKHLVWAVSNRTKLFTDSADKYGFETQELHCKSSPDQTSTW